MKIKDGVSMVGIQIEMRPVLINADAIWRTHGQELVVTAVCGGMHSAGSLHYYGYAVDLRTRYFGTEQIAVIASVLRRVLGEDYDVVIHETHIHVEFDPKQGAENV